MSRERVDLPENFDPEIERTLRQRLRMQAREPMEGRDPNVPYHVDQPQPRAEEARSLRDYAQPTILGAGSSIARPEIGANHFEIKPAIIQMIQQSVQFGGLAHEDPNSHLSNFLEICDTFKQNGVTDDAVRLRLFPFSLRDRAKSWLNSLPTGSITNWDQMAMKFLDKYFPPAKTARMRNDISTFLQGEFEPLYEAWERYKELLRRCPHHGLPVWMQVQTFYNGLSGNTRGMVDAAAGGTLMRKTPEAAYELLEEMALNAYQWPTERLPANRTTGAHSLDAVSALTAQMEALGRKVDSLKLQQAPQLQPVASCNLCGGGHSSTECESGNPFASSSSSSDQVNFVSNFNRNNNPYSETYNPGWRNHPNFSWGGNKNFRPNAPRPPPPGFPTQENKSNLEDLLTKFVSATDARFQNQEASIRNLETQISQLAKLVSSRVQGSLPSNTEPNPREDLKAITLRSGKELVEPRAHMETRAEDLERSSDTPLQENEGSQDEVEEKKSEKERGEYEKGKEKEVHESNKFISFPYPQRIQKDKLDHQFSKFLEIFKKIHINIPFVEALAQMPSYAKFLKDILSNKRRIEEHGTVMLTQECSAIIQNDLPPKLKDPGSFTIPCALGHMHFDRALCDLGAGINLMPFSIYKRLGCGELTQTNITLQLADRSTRTPRGILEDVLVKVGKFIFPVDFVVLDMEVDREVPLILGRPFLATSKALIDMHAGKLILRLNDEELRFDVHKALRSPACFSIDEDYLDFADSKEEWELELEMLPLRSPQVVDLENKVTQDKEETIRLGDAIQQNQVMMIESMLAGGSYLTFDPQTVSQELEPV